MAVWPLGVEDEEGESMGMAGRLVSGLDLHRLAKPGTALKALKSTTAPGGAAVRGIYFDWPYGVGLSGPGPGRAHLVLD